jgi:hypothetical protein
MHPQRIGGSDAARNLASRALPYEIRRTLPNEQRRKPLPSKAKLQENFLLDVGTGQLIHRKTRGKAKAGFEASWLCGNGRTSPYRRVKMSGQVCYAHHIVFVLA